ncbi:hypothetical protein QQP08_019823 [Theobroma cacao]|nr:hypothetical protein QQP08_019823 [Theobroma cacao]
MAGNPDWNPLDEEEEVNPFSSPTHYSHSRLPALIPEPASYNYDRNPAIDITLDKATNLKQKERELKAKEAEIRREELITLQRAYRYFRGTARTMIAKKGHTLSQNSEAIHLGASKVFKERWNQAVEEDKSWVDPFVRYQRRRKHKTSPNLSF